MMQSKLSARTKLSSPEQRQRREERTAAIRLRFMIRRSLDERGITTPIGISDALGMRVDEASKLLDRHRWREGDVEQLQAVAARLGLTV